MITLLPLRKTNRNKYFLALAEIFSSGAFNYVTYLGRPSESVYVILAIIVSKCLDRAK